MRALIVTTSIAAGLVATSLVVACADGTHDEEASSPEPLHLVAHDAWLGVDAQDDPYPRNAGGVCLAAAVHVEGDALEVDTDLCGHVTLAQTSLQDVSAGDTLTVSLYHANLWFEEPSEALLALRLDGEEVWTKTVAIPQSAAPITESWTALADAPAGAEVLFHLSNHGSNSWFFYALTVTP